MLADDGAIKCSDKGTRLTRYATQADYSTENGNNIRFHPTAQFCTPVERYNELEEDSKYLINAMKKMCNTMPCAFFWHNGTSDPSCEFNGLHVHLIIYAEGKLQNKWSYLSLQKACKASGVSLKSQLIKSVSGIMQYLQKPPRRLLGCNNAEMNKILYQNELDSSAWPPTTYKDQIYEEVTDNEETQSKVISNWWLKELEYDPNEKKEDSLTAFIKGKRANMGEPEDTDGRGKQKMKVTQTAVKVDEIIGFMQRYKSFESDSITEQILASGDREELLKWRTLTTGHFSRQMMTQAITEMKMRDRVDGLTYMDKFTDDDDIPVPEDSMTVPKTAWYFNAWKEEQNLEPGEVLLDTYIILAQKNKKKNCLLMQGASNAGKTYWTRALTPWPDLVGQTVQSQDFAYQKCVGKDVIVIPELSLTKPEQVEELKKLMEGMPTTINVKNKEPVLLPRTPILLSCNDVPWSKSFSQERSAFLNRMYSYSNMKESTILRNAPGSANPRFFQEVFRKIKELEQQYKDNRYERQDPEYVRLSQHVRDYMTELVYLKIVKDDYRDSCWEHASLYSTMYIQEYFGRLNRDVLNEGYVKFNDQQMTTAMSTDVMASYMLSISEPFHTEDGFWDISDYRDPIYISCQTRQEMAYEDVDQFDYDSFRMGILTIENILRLITHYPDTVLSTNVGATSVMIWRYMTKICLRNILNKLQDYVENCKNLHLSKSTKYPKSWYPLLTSTPNKHLVRRSELEWPRHEILKSLITADGIVTEITQDLGRPQGDKGLNIRPWEPVITSAGDAPYPVDYDDNQCSVTYVQKQHPLMVDQETQTGELNEEDTATTEEETENDSSPLIRNQKRNLDTTDGWLSKKALKIQGNLHSTFGKLNCKAQCVSDLSSDENDETYDQFMRRQREMLKFYNKKKVRRSLFNSEDDTSDSEKAGPSNELRIDEASGNQQCVDQKKMEEIVWSDDDVDYSVL